MDQAAPASQQNQSVRKAATLLRVAAAHPGGLSVSGMARTAGLPRATALRMVESLVAERLLARLPDDRIVIGADLYQLARTADVTELMLDVSRGSLETLVELTHETITLSVVLPDGTPCVVRQLDGPYLLGLSNWVGRPVPLHASSSGKVVLAYSTPARIDALLRMPLERLTEVTITDPARLRAELATIREQGWAAIEDELEDGVASLSGAIVVAGALFGTVNVSGPSTRLDARARRDCLAAVRQACAEIEGRLA